MQLVSRHARVLKNAIDDSKSDIERVQRAEVHVEERVKQLNAATEESLSVANSAYDLIDDSFRSVRTMHSTADSVLTNYQELASDLKKFNRLPTFVINV